ncbi:hypothetical protein NW806_01310 [Synechococcus sp. W65.1]|uniref:hypothetical protein n=1 Tax=Synechococcus sp. W65.1 TaxID=2964526 RepID=UPI0039C0FC6A
MSETLQHYFERLEGQIQELKAAIERLPEQVAAALLAWQEAKKAVPASSCYSTLNADLVGDGSHNFLLEEDPPVVGNRQPTYDLAPEAQIQRLSAQLTAAYNRIAALEEQLLAQRLRK